MLNFYSQFINQDDLVFDLGANVGNRVDTFLKLGRTVVAVEPVEDCLVDLRSSFQSDPRVHIVSKAAGAAPGQAEILTSIENPKVLASLSESFVQSVIRSERFGDADWSLHFWNKRQTVEVTTLDLLIDEFGLPGFIKIDVEGYEQEVFKGLTHQVRGLSFEFHPEYLSAAFECIDRCIALGIQNFNCSVMEYFHFNTTWGTGVAMKEFIARFQGNNKLYGDIYAVS